MSEVSAPERADAVSAMQLRLLAVAENAMLVRQAVDGAARELGASDEVVDDLKLAVTEGCSNVVRYAYRGEPGRLEVSLDPTEGGFRVTIADSGSWLDRPEDSEAAGGLGIPLMEAVSRACEIKTDAKGTTVTLDFELERVDNPVAPQPGSDVGR